MKAEELRQKFLDYFEKKGHRILPSSSLIPENDSSVLFTTAGMQQFKFYYTGLMDPFKDVHYTLGEPLNNKNVATCQKCFRTSDIESVGDERHLTFFEMLGNFSFGGYFKKEAIEDGWEFVKDVLKIKQERVKISVFKGDSEIPYDEESYNIWKSLGIKEEQFIYGTKEDNFWGPTGNEGPCGPTTEIYVDGIEIWNLVFNEFYQEKDKNLKPLKIKGVDTGMGLERLALVMQFPLNKEKTIFETDLFSDLKIELKKLTKFQDERILRIILDHFRAIAFLIASGVLPSNIERGYVLRRLIRRIIRLALKIELNESWYRKALEIISLKYGKFYPEVVEKEKMLDIFMEEKEKFEETLQRGIKEWKKILSILKTKGEKEIDGKTAFYLYESFGFPREILEEMAEEEGFKVNKEQFQEEFVKHQEISRRGQEKKFGGHGLKTGVIKSKEEELIVKGHTATHLLLESLRRLISNEIVQRGSDINPFRFRLDFNFSRKLTAEEIKKVEELVNSKIEEGLIVESYETTFKEAIKNGALGVFEGRYSEKVTVYLIKNKKTGEIFSQEICAGPHVKNTKEIGKIKIIKEEGIAKGIRRIRAIVES
ncbi:MAG: alanine--tRNA ligase [Minisyncoccia bacterium]